MKLLQFPIIKITIWYVLGIAVSYYFEFSLFSIIILTCVSTLGMLFSNFYSLKKFQSQKSFAVFLYATLFFLGILLSSVRKETFHDHHFYNQNVFGKTSLINGTIIEKLKTGSKYERFVIKVNQIDQKKSFGKIILNLKKGKAENLFIGQKILITDQISTNPKPDNPNQFDYGEYLKTRNIYGQIFTDASAIKVNFKPEKSIRYYTAQFRETIIKNLKEAWFPERESAVINALILGQQQEISRDIVKDYQFAGAVHILSVSGLHIGFILLFVTFLLKPIPKTKLGNTSRFLLTVTALWAFAFIAGLAPSVIRSTVMFSIIAYGNYLKRESNVFNTAVASMFIILVFEPYILFDIGFQLSYLAVFSLLTIEPLLAKIWQPENRLVTFFWKIMTVSFAAQIGTLPLSLYYFHQFPGLFFITNLVVIPFLEFLIMPLGCLLTVAAYFNFTPEILIQAVAYSIKGMNYFINLIASAESFVLRDIPFTNSMLLLSYIFLITLFSWIYKPGFKKLILSITILLFLQANVLWNHWNAKTSKSFIVFNTLHNTIIGETKNQETAVHYRNRINKETFEENMLKTFSTANFSRIKTFQPLKNCYYFKNKKILLIDSTAAYPKNRIASILILTQSPKINLDRILNNLKPEQVVADASNYKNYIEMWKRTCQKRKIPFHSTYEKGFYKID
ncbi:ComEC/Rec2 family competence protein [Flavobacterium sp. H122]|uniref:ComEC/Rec2 family competence protein n=1 Tax=Flavobacterium sp. H122 TaxID=2529860 RepID=UPI0010A9BC21|nr:ComEC/Rec2 family competence protein [Flavobacterium sp. H122]